MTNSKINIALNILTGNETDINSIVRLTGDYLSVGICPGGGRADCSLCGRGEITGLSDSAGGRLRRYLSSCEADYRVFITLTYPDGHGTDGERCKRDLKVFIQWLKRKAGMPDYSTFWFMEFTESGRIHFHLFTTHYVAKSSVGKKWAEICETGDRNHELCGTRVEGIKKGRAGMASYAAKYACKQSQKEVPEGFGWVGRFWGVSGLRKVVEASTLVSARDKADPAVRKCLYELSSFIDLAIETKKIVPVETSNDFVDGFQVESGVVRSVLEELIDALSDAVMHFRLESFYTEPECRYDELTERMSMPGYMNPAEVSSWLSKNKLTGDTLENNWREYGCTRRELMVYEQGGGV